MTSLLQDKTIFISGAGGVLGHAYVEAFLTNGAVVIATDLPGKKSDSLKDRFSSHNNFTYYDLDVSDEAQVKQIFKTLLADGYKPNVVLNNAAITGELLMGAGNAFPEFRDTSLDDWEKTMRVNLTAPFLLARQMDIDIVGQYPAQLINVSSIYGLSGPHHPIYKDMSIKPFSAYSASKAGIHGLTLWLAGYWAPRNCTVNTFAPGAVFNGHSQEFQDRVGGLIMAGRMAKPEEIANVMKFLCSENARYMTGQLVNADGGFSGW